MNRISVVLRDAAKMFRLSVSQQEDTVTLDEGGSGVPSSSNTQSNLSGSQVRLFKQQKRPSRISLPGSKLGWKRKNSTVTKDSGHYNAFEIAVGRVLSPFCISICSTSINILLSPGLG